MEKRVNQKKNRNRSRKTKKFSWKLFCAFVGFQIIFAVLTAPFLLLYGPFENAKSRFIGTAMGSMHYQWLATTFLSDEEIAEITGTSMDFTAEQDSNDNLINIPRVQDDSVTYGTLDNNDNFSGHVIFVNDPSRIKIGYTSKLNSATREGETTSQIAINNNAVAAVNGGAFTDEANSQEWTANGGTPSGVIINNGEVIYDDSEGRELGTIAMTKEGRLIIGYYTLDELLDKNVTEAVSYGTKLIVNNGKATSLVGDGGEGSSSRTLIGQKQDGSIVLVVLDSKNRNRIAATIKEAQEVMVKLGCITAGTLDGGRSTTMYYNGEVVNDPSYALGERYIPTAIIVQ